MALEIGLPAVKADVVAAIQDAARASFLIGDGPPDPAVGKEGFCYLSVPADHADPAKDFGGLYIRAVGGWTRLGAVYLDPTPLPAP